MVLQKVYLGTVHFVLFLPGLPFFGILDPLGVQMEARTAKITKMAPTLPPKWSPGHSKFSQNTKKHGLVTLKKPAKKCDSGPLFFTLPKQ